MAQQSKRENASEGSAIELRDLHKTYRVSGKKPGIGGWLSQWIRPEYSEKVAVGGISFQIRRGERVAFVGPNGAGKSTTIKMLTGILHPSSGDVSVLGLVPWKQRKALSFRIGTVFGQRSQLWSQLPARATFELLARVYEIDDRVARQRIGELCEVFEIEDLQRQSVRQLSLGQRMRCEIAASLLHRPQVLFLDEPTIGLDVTAKQRIRDLLWEMSRRDGTTLLFTSHDTGDMERVCDRVIVIDDGAVILDRSVSSLRQDFLRRKLVTLLTTEERLDIALEGTRVVERRPYRTVLEVKTDEVSVADVVQMGFARAKVKDLTIEDPPLEEVVSPETG